MATGHILPGFGYPVTRLRRAHTAYPLDRQKLQELAARNIPDLDPRTLDNIRENARNMWLNPHYQPTTYNTFHTGRPLDEPTELRCTEPARRHKPHPKPVFLTNRLHYVPGYHNADATMGKDVYRMDDSFPEEERQLRRHQREKFIARPRTAAVDQYREPWAPLTDAIGPVEAWGAQAWLKTADDDHQHEVVNAIRDYRDKELFDVPTGSRYPIPLLIQPLVSHQLQIHSSKHEDQNYLDQDQKNMTKPTEEAKPGDCRLPNDTTVDMVGHKYQKIEQKCTNDRIDDLQKKSTAEVEVKTKTDKISEKKKPFPIKVMSRVNNVVDKDTVEIIINNINNKIPHKGCRTHQYLQSNQRVTFKSPVQEQHKKSHSAKEKEPTSTPSTSIVENVVKNKHDGNTDEMNPTTKENKVTITMQSPAPPPVMQSPAPPPIMQFPVPTPVPDTSPRPYTAIPSMHRWMKHAGAAESEHVRRILYGGYPPSTIQPLGSLGNPGTTLQRRQQEMNAIKKSRYVHKSARGDFLIHPEYPPTFPHHRID